jgi:hypothetical protein
VNWCSDRPLPSHTEIASLAGADAVVLNFGLHYHSFADYERMLRTAAVELEAFGRGAGRAALWRETSAQNFPGKSGDYDEAVASGAALVLKENATDDDRPAERADAQWLGPSMCKPHSGRLARGGLPHLKAGGWRNELLRKVLGEAGASHVQVQPFEAMTAERWDYMASTKWVANAAGPGKWLADCTHLCYSPAFWDLTIHDLHAALLAGFGVQD